MKWGYNHQLGPFETWDAIGVREAVEVMKKLKKKVPRKIEEMLKKSHESFYIRKEDGRYFYDFETKDYLKLEENPRIILLPELKERNKVVRKNASATLVDIGDGVACLEFHTKMNAVDDGMIEMIFASCDIVEKDFVGMVVGNHGTNFSAGANIFKVLLAIQRGGLGYHREAGCRLPGCEHADEVSFETGCHGTGRPRPRRRLRNIDARGQVPAVRRKPIWAWLKLVWASSLREVAVRN